jgi:7,8-dihydropterin-6-yl-methyl-4-(beta-D-ribofuranosyl)aminobenzene 5'-phosphate synthase
MFQADSLEITVLVENWADALLPDVHDGGDGDHCVTRHGLIELFDPARPVQPQAEMGLSLLVRARSGRRELTVLFDAGLTGTVLLNNLAALRQNPDDVNSIVISHGHPDHFGGVHAFLGALDTPRPLITHEDAFLPRTAILGDGAAATHYNAAFTQDSLARAGATTMLTTEPVELGAGVVTTGIIPRITDFEGPRPPARRGAPGLYQLGPDGDFRLD